jgi:peroxidase
VEDIDLFTGGLSEPTVPDGLVGKTFGCIIATQFKRLRKCDRYWYETPDHSIGFTPSQLTEIKKVTLASLICRNRDVLTPLQRTVFDLPNEEANPIMECAEHPAIDIIPWMVKRQPQGLDYPWSCDVNGWILKPGSEKRISACIKVKTQFFLHC